MFVFELLIFKVYMLSTLALSNVHCKDITQSDFTSW